LSTIAFFSIIFNLIKLKIRKRPTFFFGLAHFLGDLCFLTEDHQPQPTCKEVPARLGGGRQILFNIFE
jgi:hypothetical protein